MKFETIKSGSIIAITIAVLICAWVGAKEIRGHFLLRNKLVNEEMVILKKNIVSQRVQIDTKILEDKIKDLNNSILAIVKERNQQITDIGKSVSKIKQTVDLQNRESNKSYEGREDKPKDKMQYEFKKIYSKDANGEKYPVAWVMFFPNQTPDKMWKSGTYPIEIHQKLVIAENRERTDSIVEVWLENNQQRETKGNMYPVEIESLEWVKREKTTKEWMFNPRLSLNMNVGTEIYPSIGVSLFSYGRTDVDMDWRFIDFGIGGTSDDLYFSFTPVEYNLGNIPGVNNLIKNFFVGPYIAIDSEIEYEFGGQFGIPF